MTASQNGLGTYAVLVRRVRETIALGRKRAEDVVEREKVRTSWEVGKLIHKHVLLHTSSEKISKSSRVVVAVYDDCPTGGTGASATTRDRADYGKQVMKRLSADLATSEAELYRMVEFARTYPIFAPARKLSWAHYRELLAINDDEKRKEFIGEASRNDWTRQTLRREIRKLKLRNSKAIGSFPIERPLAPNKGMLEACRIVTAEAGPGQGKPMIDLGFSNYLSVRDLKISTDGASAVGRKRYRSAGNFRFRENEIIRVSNGKPARLKDGTEKDLFTYRAYVLEVTDGDTFWVLLDLGFGFTTKQHLRLRGLDASEIATRDGMEAKRFVERELKNASGIVITSSKSDKYDRYLADVFYLPARNVKIPAGGTRAMKARVYQTKKGEQYLNNRLLQENLAVRVPE